MRVVMTLGRLRSWATGHWLRTVIIAGTVLTLVGVTIGGWAYLASAALRVGEPNLPAAMEAYDKGDFEAARSMVSHLLTNGRFPHSEFGGPLFILGAIKVRDAEQQAAPERRRIEYSIASRYLTEANGYGFPLDRDQLGHLLLGRSLVESGQFEEGIDTLKGAIAAPATPDATVKQDALYLLADTCLMLPKPRAQEALGYNDALLELKDATSERRTAALLQRAECLAALDRYAEAKQAIASLPPGADKNPHVALTEGRILLDEVEASLEKLTPADRPQAAAAQADKISAAFNDFMAAMPSNEQKDRNASQSLYQLGRGLVLRGDLEEAFKQFQRARQLYPDTYEGLAASLGEGQLLRAREDYDAAMLSYRRVLEAYSNIPVYRSHTLSTERIREQLVDAQADFTQHGRFEDALSLIAYFRPLFTQAEQLELQGDALEHWAVATLAQAAEDTPTGAANRQAGLEHYRSAGMAFEQLAELRFATKFYTNDLWRAAEDFYHGHCYSRAIKSLQKYLQYEPELRNAQALLRSGQSQLALGHIPESIAAFEECIEFHPLDTATFQARIDCSRAYWCLGKNDRAEELLRENIGGSSLKPASPEWKDSLFELGNLQHEREKYEAAIGTLEEAIERYPDDPRKLMAKYEIGESYRRWAKQLADEIQKSRSGTEQEKSKQLVNERLLAALRQFQDVQRTITLKVHDIHSDPLTAAMLRNCYMLEGAVMFDLGRYKEAIEAYSNVSSLYPDEPFVLETFVQISNCWRRLNRRDNARGAVHQAQIVLDRLPPSSDFASATVLNREEWRMLLANMSKW